MHFLHKDVYSTQVENRSIRVDLEKYKDAVECFVLYEVLTIAYRTEIFLVLVRYGSFP